jgi:hypothetical protein
MRNEVNKIGDTAVFVLLMSGIKGLCPRGGRINLPSFMAIGSCIQVILILLLQP